MGVSTWMLSLLVREFDQLGPAFPAKYGPRWLVWEPGAWRPAKTVNESNTRSTVDLSQWAHNARPRGTDAFCFQLDPAPGQLLVLGRASESDVLVNDLTISRRHLIFKDGHVSLAPECTAATTFNGAPTTPGVWARLSDGFDLRTGEVRLTFYETAGFLERLARERELAREARRRLG